MFYYYLLLNKHKNLSLKRSSDYKRNLIITASIIIFSIAALILLLLPFAKEDFKTIAAFIVPAIVVSDFSFRFFLKKRASAAIFPYLTLPVPHKTLILYIVFSDLLHFRIWGCWLIYCTIVYYSGALTFWNVIIVLFFVFLNNYLIAFVKTLMDGYAILIYPICLGFVLVILLVVDLLSPVFAISIIAFAVFSLIAALFFTLKENLLKELNRIAL